jgi:cytoskeleton-associated protein 5
MIREIDTEDLGSCSEALKQVQAAIASSADSLIPYADELMDAITRQMSLGFDNLNADTSQAQLRLCKHLMQALSSFFDTRTLGEAVSTPMLTLLLAELTARLLDTAESSASEAISSLSKVLNMVLIRIFHHAEPNAVFR